MEVIFPFWEQYSGASLPQANHAGGFPNLENQSLVYDGQIACITSRYMDNTYPITDLQPARLLDARQSTKENIAVVPIENSA